MKLDVAEIRSGPPTASRRRSEDAAAEAASKRALYILPASAIIKMFQKLPGGEFSSTPYRQFLCVKNDNP